MAEFNHALEGERCGGIVLNVHLFLLLHTDPSSARALKLLASLWWRAAYGWYPFRVQPTSPAPPCCASPPISSSQKGQYLVVESDPLFLFPLPYPFRTLTKTQNTPTFHSAGSERNSKLKSTLWSKSHSQGIWLY
jgi:hypothetical protein